MDWSRLCWFHRPALPAPPPPPPPPPRKMLFDWTPIERDEPASDDFGDNANFHLIPTPRAHRSSTVAALFRFHPLPGGFATTWRWYTVARNHDGTHRWTLPTLGKYLAVAPGGARVALTALETRHVTFVDAASGAILHTSPPLAPYLWDLAWSADGQRVLVIGDSEVIVLDASNGAELRRIRNFTGDRPVLGSIVALPDGRFAVSQPNERIIAVIDETTDAIEAVKEPRARNLFLSPSGRFLWSGATEGVYARTLPGFAESGWFKTPGKFGVRVAGSTDYSYVQFEPIPRMSDDDKLVLVNDRTGQLWLTSAMRGTPYYRWPRDVLDEVEDTWWVSDVAFLVATNEGRVRRMSFYSLEPEWEVFDAP